MAKKSKVAEKPSLTTAQIKAKVNRWRALEEEMAPLETELKAIKTSLVAALEVKDAFEFGEVTLRIMQGKSRKGLNWKAIAFGLAKRLYPTAALLRQWLRDLARKYPNKPNAAYARLFVKNSTEEEAA
jgi:hypothetical protein